MPFPDYSISTEFTSGLVEAKLHAEIVAAGPYTPTFLGLTVSGDICSVLFNTTPPGPEQTTVDAVIAAHDGTTEPPTKTGGQMPAFTANDAIFVGPSIAAATTRNGHAVLAFDDTTAENIIIEGVLSESYDGGPIEVDICWVAASAIVGDVVWGVEFEQVTDGGHDIDADNFAPQKTATGTTDVVAGVLARTVISLSNAEADTILAGDGFRLRLQRVATDVGDTLVGDAHVLRVVLEET